MPNLENLVDMIEEKLDKDEEESLIGGSEFSIWTRTIA